MAGELVRNSRALNFCAGPDRQLHVSAGCIGDRVGHTTVRDPIRRSKFVAVGDGIGSNEDEERGRGIGILFSLVRRVSG